LVSGDEPQLDPSVGDDMRCSYRTRSATPYAAVDDADVLLMSSNSAIIMSPTEKKRIVERIRNVFNILYLARAVIVLSQCHLSLK
jgi:hypothetical protein